MDIAYLTTQTKLTESNYEIKSQLFRTIEDSLKNISCEPTSYETDHVLVYRQVMNNKKISISYQLKDPYKTLLEPALCKIQKDLILSGFSNYFFSGQKLVLFIEYKSFTPPNEIVHLLS